MAGLALNKTANRMAPFHEAAIRVANDQACLTGPFLGVVEDRPGANAGEPHRSVVRAIFHKIGDEWRPFNVECNEPRCLAAGTGLIPQHTDWAISRHGEALGAVSVDAPDAWEAYSDIGTQQLAAQPNAYARGPSSLDFAGWGGEPVFRPLVATSPAAFRDPEAWTPAPAPPASAQELRRRFRARFPNVANCESAEENIERSYRYGDRDMKISDAHASSSGWIVATLTLHGYECDGPLSENSAFLPQVFAISPAGKAQLLGEGLRFIDAGDFDGRRDA